MKKWLLSLLVFPLLLSGCSSESGGSGSDLIDEKGLIAYSHKFPEFKIKNDDVKNAEPAILFAYSNQLFAQDKHDEAVFWFYLAQSRNRYLLSATEEPTPVTPELFLRFYRESGFVGNVSVPGAKGLVTDPDSRYPKMNAYYDSASRQNIHKASSGLGEVINPYAFQNLDKLQKQLDKLIAYEKANPFNPAAVISEADLVSREKLKELHEKSITTFEEAKVFVEKNKDSIREKRSKNGLKND